MWYLVGAGIVAIGIIGYILLSTKKQEGELTVENKDADVTNVALKQEVEIANTPVSPEEAYAGLKGEPAKTDGGKTK